jgi:hypothetical protein
VVANAVIGSVEVPTVVLGVGSIEVVASVLVEVSVEAAVVADVEVDSVEGLSVVAVGLVVALSTIVIES